ncbi:MAG: helix-turn-helix transcriptional regulator [Spirochaetales bacterium]|nr:helix-turn-helix transcriptional regulator [Spirochaetales bacterium]
MVLKHIAYFFSILCLCSGAINLTLSLIYRKIRKTFWMKYYLAFLVSFTLLIIIHTLRLFYAIVPLPQENILNIVLTAIFIIDLSFLMYYVPFFSTWLVRIEWKNPWKTIIPVLTVAFFTLGCLYVVFNLNIIFYSLMIAMFATAVLGCIILVLKNRERITDPELKRTWVYFIIISAVFCPVIILDAFLTYTKGSWIAELPRGVLSFPLYYLWMNIIVIIYLINQFLHMPENISAGFNYAKTARFHITDREMEIIRFLQAGLPYKEIAVELCISANTVNNHVAKIYAKTGARNRFELMRSLS